MAVRTMAAFGLAAAVLCGTAAPLQAYLHLSASVGGQATPVAWGRMPVRWFASGTGIAGTSAADLQAAVSRAFAVWEAVPTASVSFEFVGFTGAAPSDEDGLSVFGFESHPDEDRTLASTSFTVDTLTGEILESDVFFNTALPWSASGAATAFDLQSIATHEIGHFLGLGHSGLGETELQAGGGRRVLATASVMFPIAFGRGITADRTLQPDDIAGVSATYPDGAFRESTGSLQGRVRLGGRGVFGAHVAAFNPRTGVLIGGFALGREGEFVIAGLSPGAYVVRVEPLDDAATDSFFDDPGLDTNFRATLYDHLVGVPAGGASAPFDVAVQPK